MAKRRRLKPEEKVYSKSTPITFEGKTQTVSEWANERNINPVTALSRLNEQKWTVERTFTIEPNTRQNSAGNLLKENFLKMALRVFKKNRVEAEAALEAALLRDPVKFMKDLSVILPKDQVDNELGNKKVAIMINNIVSDPRDISTFQPL